MPLVSSTGLKVFLRTRCPLVSYHWSNLNQNGMPLVIRGWERDVDRGWGYTSRRSCLRILFQGIKPYVVQVKDFTRVFSLSFCQGRPFGFSSLAFFLFFLFIYFFLSPNFCLNRPFGFSIQRASLKGSISLLYLIKGFWSFTFHLLFDRDITRDESSASAFNSIVAWNLIMHSSNSTLLLVT